MACAIVHCQMGQMWRLASSVDCTADCLYGMICKGLIQRQKDSCKRAGEGPCSQAQGGKSAHIASDLRIARATFSQSITARACLRAPHGSGAGGALGDRRLLWQASLQCSSQGIRDNARVWTGTEATCRAGKRNLSSCALQGASAHTVLEQNRLAFATAFQPAKASG